MQALLLEEQRSPRPAAGDWLHSTVKAQACSYLVEPLVPFRKRQEAGIARDACPPVHVEGRDRPNLQQPGVIHNLCTGFAHSRWICLLGSLTYSRTGNRLSPAFKDLFTVLGNGSPAASSSHRSLTVKQMRQRRSDGGREKAKLQRIKDKTWAVDCGPSTVERKL